MKNLLKSLLLWLSASLWDMLMPPWCCLEAYSGDTESELQDEASVACVMTLSIIWLNLYFNLADNVSKMAKDAQEAKMNFEAERKKNQRD